MKLKYFIIIPICLIANCLNNPDDEIKEILWKTDHYQYKMAIKELNKFIKKYPEYKKDFIDPYLFLAKCYEVTGDFDNLHKVYKIARKRYTGSFFKLKYGVDFHDLYMLRFALKDLQYERFYRTISMFDDDVDLQRCLDSTPNYEEYKFIRYVIYESRIDLCVDPILLFKYNKINEKAFLELSELRNFVMFDFILQLENKIYVKEAFANLLNYKTVDGKYYVDLIWKSEVTKKYFKIFIKRGLLTEDTIKGLKGWIYRDDFPEAFKELCNESFGKRIL